MNLIKRLKTVYKENSDIYREKAVTLFIINAMLILFFALFAGIRLRAGSYIVAFGELSVSVILIINIIILFKGGYKVSSIVSIFIFSAAAFVIFLIQEHNELDDLYKFSTYIISVICVAPLLSYNIWQMILVAGFGFAGQIIFYFFLLLPIAVKNNETNFLGQFIISATFLFMAALFAVLVFRNQLRSIKAAETEKNSAEKRFIQINAIIDEMRDSFDIGEKLLSAAESTSRSAGNISANLKSMESIVEHLEASAGVTYAANSRIMKSEKMVKEKMDVQTNAITSSSEAIEQIVEKISFVSRLAEQKLGRIEGVNRTSRQGESRLDDSIKALGRLSESTDNILEIIEVIESISSRTNMLAMNAAIEAAHAGDAGKGFAVVAEEIRKLSEETSQNSEAIRKSIISNNEHFTESDRAAKGLQEFFSDLIIEILNIGKSLGDIVGSMNDLSTGTDSISDSIINLRSSNESVHDSLDSMVEEIRNGNESIAGIRTAVGQTRDNVESLKSLGELIVRESSGLEEVGGMNKTQMELLNEELKNING